MKKYLIIYFLIFLFPISVWAKTDTARNSIVMDMDSGRILYQKNINEKRLIASTTKIMTAILALERGNLEKNVTVGDEVLSMYGTNIYVEVGEKMRLLDLIYGLLLRSGNDASLVIAKAIAGSEEEFVKLMNKKAQEIGMKNTIFKNPHGLDEETQNKSTVYDMALLSKYAYQNEIYRKIVSTKEYTVKTKDKTYLWYNRNKLLTLYKYATGGKNGYTPKAGKTLVTTASFHNLNLTTVTFYDGDPFTNHKNLYQRIFSTYQNYKIVDPKTFSIDKNFTDENVYIKNSFSYPLTKEEAQEVKTFIQVHKDIVSKKVGKIDIYLQKEKIGSVPIYKKEKEKKSFFQKIKTLFTG